MNRYPSPRELAEEMLQALRETRMSPHEHIEFLIREGIIDRNGRVLVNKLFGGKPQDETNGAPPVSDAPRGKKASDAK
jgi:hypothetical protein